MCSLLFHRTSGWHCWCNDLYKPLSGAIGQSWFTTTLGVLCCISSAGTTPKLTEWITSGPFSLKIAHKADQWLEFVMVWDPAVWWKALLRQDLLVWNVVLLYLATKREKGEKCVVRLPTCVHGDWTEIQTASYLLIIGKVRWNALGM